MMAVAIARLAVTIMVMVTVVTVTSSAMMVMMVVVFGVLLSVMHPQAGAVKIKLMSNERDGCCQARVTASKQ